MGEEMTESSQGQVTEWQGCAGRVDEPLYGQTEAALCSQGLVLEEDFNHPK